MSDTKNESKIETTDAQNTISRMHDDIYLNVDKPTLVIQLQYAKVMNAIINLQIALGTLNDMKGGSL